MGDAAVRRGAGRSHARHAHDWPHINFVVAGGSGVLLLDGVEHPIASGAYAYVPAGHEHQFRARCGRSALLRLHRAGGRRLLRHEAGYVRPAFRPARPNP